MAFETTKITKINLGTVRSPKYRVYDALGSTSFSLASSTFTLKNSKSRATVLDGSAAVNNSDTDTAGNAIKTVSAVIDLTSSDGVEAEKGMHWLHFFITFGNGDTDVLRVPVEIVDFREP